MGTPEVSDIRAPNISTNTPYRELESSDNDFINEIAHRNEDWLTKTKGQRRRLFRNIKAYVPVDGSSWDDESRKQVIADGRHAVNIDVASRKIDTLGGSILSEKWDFDFQALDQENSYTLRNLKYWYHADAEQYNYHNSENKCCIRGLLHSGYEELTVRYDLRPHGALAFSAPQSGMVLKDPYWLTDDLKDWKRAIKHGWFTPQEMIDKWDVSNDDFRSRARDERNAWESVGHLDNVDTFQGVPNRWGDKYLVLEYRWIEEKKTSRLYGKTKNGDWMEFPLDIETRADVQKYMKRYGITDFGNVKEFPYTGRVLKLGVCCPEISRTAFLYEGDHDVQCGFIGFFPFSPCREMGIDKGVMDAAIDLVRTLNYRESKKDDIIASMAADVKVINIDALDETQTTFREITENITKPGYTIAAHGDPRLVASQLANKEVPQSIMNDIGQTLSLFNEVLPVTPALEGTGPQSESGVLFEMRHAVTKLGTLILYDNWRQHLMNKAEAWYNQARITYKDQYRKVRNTDDDSEIEFNKPQYQVDGESAERFYENSIGDLPRANVYVTLRKDSPTQRIGEQAMLYDITKILSAHPELFQAEIRILTNRILQTIDLDPQEKKKVEMLGKLKEMRDMLAAISEIEGTKAQTAQAMLMQQQAVAMLKQMAQQMGMQPGAEGPQGAPGGGPPQGQPTNSRPEQVAPPEEDLLSTSEQYQQIPQEGG